MVEGVDTINIYVLAHEEKLLDVMVNLWVKDDAPEWVKQKAKEELRKQRIVI